MIKGKLYEADMNTLVVLCTEDSFSNTFSGVVVHPNLVWNLGHYNDSWASSTFKQANDISIEKNGTERILKV